MLYEITPAIMAERFLKSWQSVARGRPLVMDALRFYCKQDLERVVCWTFYVLKWMNHGVVVY